MPLVGDSCFEILVLVHSGAVSEDATYRRLASLYTLRTASLDQFLSDSDVARADLVIFDVPVVSPELIRSLRSIRRHSSYAPIAAYIELSPSSAHDIVELAKAGLDHVIIKHVEDLVARVQQLRKGTIFQHLGNMVVSQLQTSPVPFFEELMLCCFRHGRQPCSVDALAAELGIPRRTLAKRLSDAGVPPASELLAWTRLIRAAACLQTPDCSVEAVGFGLGFGSGAGLRNMLLRYTGMYCKEIRAPMGLSKLVLLFCATLQNYRGA